MLKQNRSIERTTDQNEQNKLLEQPVVSFKALIFLVSPPRTDGLVQRDPPPADRLVIDQARYYSLLGEVVGGTIERKDSGPQQQPLSNIAQGRKKEWFWLLL